MKQAPGIDIVGAGIDDSVMPDFTVTMPLLATAAFGGMVISVSSAWAISGSS